MNNESNIDPTVATPPLDVLKIMILQRRDDALSSVEYYYKMSCAGAGAPSHTVKARVRSLFLELEASLKRREYEGLHELEDMVFDDDINEVIKAFRKLNVYLDEMNITKVDIRKRIDSKNVENENTAKGL